MKRSVLLVQMLALGGCLLLSPLPGLHAQSGAAVQKVEQMAQQLNLTPRQKMRVLPILRAEAPKVQAIRNDASLTGMQKIERLKGVHDETDPQLRAILTPAQYSTLQEMRKQEIQQAIQKKMK